MTLQNNLEELENLVSDYCTLAKNVSNSETETKALHQKYKAVEEKYKTTLLSLKGNTEEGIKEASEKLQKLGQEVSASYVEASILNFINGLGKGLLGEEFVHATSGTILGLFQVLNGVLESLGLGSFTNFFDTPEAKELLEKGLETAAKQTGAAIVKAEQLVNSPEFHRGAKEAQGMFVQFHSMVEGFMSGNFFGAGANTARTQGQGTGPSLS